MDLGKVFLGGLIGGALLFYTCVYCVYIVCICACVLVHLMTSGLPDQLSRFLLYLSRYLCLPPISLLSIYSTIKEFYWPYLSDSSLYTIVKFKCLWFLKQEFNLPLKKGSFLNHSAGLQH